MAFEYQILTYATLFYMFAWLPSSVGKFRSFGGRWLASNREHPGKELLPWAARCERAYANLKDYFPAFVVAILLLGVLGKFDGTTSVTAALFLLGRVLHFLAYAIGSVPGRFVSYLVAMGANLFLLVKVLL